MSKNITFDTYGFDLLPKESQIDLYIPSLLTILFHWRPHDF
jgi:hypothetical protein